MSFAGKSDSGVKAACMQAADIQPLSLHFTGLLVRELLSEHSLSFMATHDECAIRALRV